MGAANRVAVNTGILYARMAITVFISLYATRLVLAALGAEDYGIFNVVGGAVAMLTFLHVAMASASQRFMSYAQGEGDQKKQKYIFNVSVTLHFIIAIIVAIIIEIGGYFLFNGILEIPADRVKVAKLIYHLMVFSTFFSIISVPYEAVINAHENMLLVAILGIIEALSKLGIALYITYTSFDKLISYSALMVLLPLLILILRGAYCHKMYEEVVIRPMKYYSKPLFKEMTSFAGWSFLTSFASIVSMQGMSIILNSFFGVLLNAAQGIASQVSGQLMAFSTTMLKALNPVIVKSEGGKNRNQMLQASNTGNKLSFFLIAFFATPVILEMPLILGFWLKEVPEYAVIFCRLRLVVAFINQLTVTFSTAIGAIGDIKKFSFWNSLIWMSLLPISYVAFRLGSPPEMIYVIFIVVNIFLGISRVYFLKLHGGISIRDFIYDVLARCLTSAFLSAVLAYIPIIFISSGAFRLILVVAINSIAFIIFLFLIGFNEREKQLILSAYDTVISKIKR